MYKTSEVITNILPFKTCVTRLRAWALLNGVKKQINSQKGGREYVWTEKNIKDFIKYKERNAVQKIHYKKG